MAKKPNNHNQESHIKKDLRFNIKRANEIVRLSENRKYKFLEINLAFVTVFSFLFVYILENFNDGGKLSVITSMVIYFGATSINIIYNLKENRTQVINKSLCSQKGWKHSDFLKKMDNINNYDFLKDYKIQIINLHKYEKNYNKIGRKTRLITLTGLLILLITFIISIIINFIGFNDLVWNVIIIIVLSNIIPSLIIIGVIWFLKYKK